MEPWLVPERMSSNGSRQRRPPAWIAMATTAVQELLRYVCTVAVNRGALEIWTDLRQDGGHLQMRLRGCAGRVFSTRAGRRLEKLLRRSAATVTLRIEELRGDQRQQLDRLLRRLAPYGDRVSIWLGARVRPLLAVDSSIFHLLLEDSRAPASP